MDEYYSAITALPAWLAQPLAHVPPEIACRIHEIRLRRGCPVFVTFAGMQMPLGDCCPAQTELQDLTVPGQQMDDLVYRMCGESVHSFESELSHGYFTLPGGHRVGVGGRYVRRADGAVVLQKVDSLDLRIARFLLCQLPPFLCALLQSHFTGLLIVGEPDSGKTTVLRSILPVLAKARRPAAVIDERSEIFPDTLSGPAGSCWCDRIAGVDKITAMEMALRALSPQVMLLDELGTMAETQLLEQGFFSGVDFVATLHAGSLAEAEQRPQVQYLRAHRMLHAICLLEGRQRPGCVKEGRNYC